MEKQKWPLYHIHAAWPRMQNPLSTEGNESFALVGELVGAGQEDRKVPSICFFLLDPLILSISANPRGASKQMKKAYLKGAWVYQPCPVVELKIWYRVNSLPLLLVRFSVHIYCCTRLEISHRFHCAPKPRKQEHKRDVVLEIRLVGCKIRI